MRTINIYRISSSLLIFASFFIFAQSAYAVPPSVSFISDPPVVEQDKISFDFIVINPDRDISWGIYVKVQDSDFNDRCTLTPPFNTDLNGPNTYGVNIHAECDMEGWTREDTVIEIQNDGVEWNHTVLETINVDYIYAVPHLGEVEFAGEAERLEDGRFKFRIQSGSRFQSVTNNIYVRGQTPRWNGGTKYDCPSVTFTISAYSSTKEIICDFNNLEPNTYDVVLIEDHNMSPELELDVTPIEIRSAEIIGAFPVPGNPENPNIFNIEVARYSNLASADFLLKVRDGVSYLPNPIYTRSYSGTGVFSFADKNYNMLPPGTWTIELFDADGNAYNTWNITIDRTILTHTCSCSLSESAPACNETFYLYITRNSCTIPTVPKPICVEPDLSRGQTAATCYCTCDGTPKASPIEAGTPLSPDYDVSDIASFFAVLQNVIIGIAVVSGVFIIPYAFVLMSSGNPENIKKGTEWLKSIFWGYLVIFLAGALIRFVGGEFLSLGF